MFVDDPNIGAAVEDPKTFAVGLIGLLPKLEPGVDENDGCAVLNTEEAVVEAPKANGVVDAIAEVVVGFNG